jgi:transcriptional regulator with XRE-family HTH domain
MSVAKDERRELRESLPKPTRWLFAVLCYLRLKRGLSQRDLGLILDKPRTYISKYERGMIIPGVELLTQISDALQAEPAAILRMCEIMEAPEMSRTAKAS